MKKRILLQLMCCSLFLGPLFAADPGDSANGGATPDPFSSFVKGENGPGPDYFIPYYGFLDQRLKYQTEQGGDSAYLRALVDTMVTGTILGRMYDANGERRVVGESEGGAPVRSARQFLSEHYLEMWAGILFFSTSDEANEMGLSISEERLISIYQYDKYVANLTHSLVEQYAGSDEQLLAGLKYGEVVEHMVSRLTEEGVALPNLKLRRKPSNTKELQPDASGKTEGGMTGKAEKILWPLCWVVVGMGIFGFVIWQKRKLRSK